MLLIEMLVGCTLLLSGILCIVHGIWADSEETLCMPIGYNVGSLFALLGLALFVNAVHPCALSTCLAVVGPQ